jgi:hypothetical protein
MDLLVILYYLDHWSESSSVSLDCFVFSKNCFYKVRTCYFCADYAYIIFDRHNLNISYRMCTLGYDLSADHQNIEGSGHGII